MGLSPARHIREHGVANALDYGVVPIHIQSRKVESTNQPIQGGRKIRTVMYFVIVEENANRVPTESELKKAMINSGGIPSVCEGSDSRRILRYCGTVSRSRYEQELRNIVPGSRPVSWTLSWSDMPASAMATADSPERVDHLPAADLLTQTLGAAIKSIKISIDTTDLPLLKQEEYRLCFAKKTADADYNVVLQSYKKYTATNTLLLIPLFHIFCCNRFTNGGSVDAATSVSDINVGDTAILNEYGVFTTSVQGGKSTAITLKNEYGQMHPGLNQLFRGIDGTTIAAPFYVAKNPMPPGSIELTPVDKVLVWFEKDIKESTMFTNPRSLAVEIDLTATDTATRHYNKRGWTTP